MIGLIIALTVISQSGVLVETYRQEIFEEVVFKSLEDSYYGEGDVIIDIWSWQSGKDSADIGYLSPFSLNRELAVLSTMTVGNI